MPISVETFDRLEGAADALATARDARFLGGGTLIMRAVNYGDESFARIVRTTDAGFRAVSAEGRRVRIGAGVTMSRIVAEHSLDFLAPVARVIGGPAIRSMATVGGNLYAEHPYGDLTAALLVLDAKVELAGRGGRGEIALEELLRDRERSRPLVAAVSVERPAGGEFRFLKVSRVKPKGVALMSLAAWLPVSAGRITGARIAYGAMAPTPVRVPAVERALEGRSLDEAGIAPALAAAVEGLSPPTDPIASTWYRQQVAPVHLKRLLLGTR